jgi:hypothetical protein
MLINQPKCLIRGGLIYSMSNGIGTGDRDQEVQGQEVQGQGAYLIYNQEARRYPLRTRQLTITAGALARE